MNMGTKMVNVVQGLNKEQRLRQEAGQLRHSLLKLNQDKKQMQADLVAQREDMTKAIEALDRGNVREAREILMSSLAYRERTREPRKNRN